LPTRETTGYLGGALEASNLATIALREIVSFSGDLASERRGP